MTGALTFSRALLNALGSEEADSLPSGGSLSRAVLRALSRPGGEMHVESAFTAALQVEREADLVSVAATGLDWLGSGVPALEQVLLTAIGEASDEIAMTSFSVTAGASSVIDAVKIALHRGVRVTAIVNRLDMQEAAGRALLESLKKASPHSFRLWNFSQANDMESLHAKILVADRRLAVVGSANLSFLGMIANHELGVLVRGPTAATIASCIDRLLRSPYAHLIR